MRKLVLLTALALIVPLAIIPLVAHHSFAATYFVDKTVTTEGEVVQFLFRNPHSFIHVEVKNAKDPSAAPVRWAAEWAAGTALNSQGVARDVLKAGDHVILTGNPGRNQDEHRMRLNSVVRPRDGWKWSGTFQ
jgi:Family of unknown function (DUF6152)